MSFLRHFKRPGVIITVLIAIIASGLLLFKAIKMIKSFQYPVENNYIVLASNKAIAALVSAIGGDKITVKQLSSASNSSSHDLIMTPSMLSRLLKSRAVFFSSGSSEPVMRQLSQRAKTKNIRFIEIINHASFIDIIEKRYYSPLEKEQNYNANLKKNQLDPHFWISPYSALAGAKVIFTELVNLFGYKEYFENNYNKLAKELQDIYSKTYNNISACQNQLFSMHNGYFYLYKDYNLNYIGNISHDIESGISPHKIIDAKKAVHSSLPICLLVEEGTNLDNILKEITLKLPHLKTVKVDTDGIKIVHEEKTFLTYMKDNLERVKSCVCAK